MIVRGIQLLMVLFAVGAAGCKVRQIPDVVNYTFTNNTGQHITLDLYPTRDDYAQNTNRMSRSSIDAGKSAVVPLARSSNMWVDWYSDDYSVSNWQAEVLHASGGWVNQLAAETQTGIEDRQIGLSPYKDYSDTSRSILINGNDLSTTWEIRIEHSSNAAEVGTHRFELHKDYTCVYTFTNSSGVASTKTAWYGIRNFIPYKATRAHGFYFEVFNNDANATAIMNVTFNDQVLASGRLSRDTLAGFTPSGSPGLPWPLVRR